MEIFITLLNNLERYVSIVTLFIWNIIVSKTVNGVLLYFITSTLGFFTFYIHVDLYISSYKSVIYQNEYLSASIYESDWGIKVLHTKLFYFYFKCNLFWHWLRDSTIKSHKSRTKYAFSNSPHDFKFVLFCVFLSLIILLIVFFQCLSYCMIKIRIWYQLADPNHPKWVAFALVM